MAKLALARSVRRKLRFGMERLEDRRLMAGDFGGLANCWGTQAGSLCHSLKGLAAEAIEASEANRARLRIVLPLRSVNLVRILP